MSQRAFRKGVEDLGNGLLAYVQPDGSWGWSNAGLITDGDRTLLVDTLFTLHLAREANANEDPGIRCGKMRTSGAKSAATGT